MIAIEIELINMVGYIEIRKRLSCENVFIPLPWFIIEIPLEVVADASRVILYWYCFWRSRHGHDGMKTQGAWESLSSCWKTGIDLQANLGGEDFA